MEKQINSKAIYMQLSEPAMFKFCFQKCINKKPGTSLTATEESCFETCTPKIINAYSFMIDVLEAGGIQRDYTISRMKGTF